MVEAHPTTATSAVSVARWSTAPLRLAIALMMGWVIIPSQAEPIKQSAAISKAGVGERKIADARHCSRTIPVYSPQEKKNAIARLADKGIIPSNSNLLDAIKLHDVPDILDLLKAGVDPNMPINSPPVERLFLVPKNSDVDIEIARLLISHGANINHPSSSILVNAVYSKKIANVYFLISQCADVNSNSARAMPLDLAISLESIDMVGLLLKSGADPRRRGKSIYPMCTAAGTGLEYVKLLMEYGATPQDGESETTLSRLREGEVGIAPPLMCALFRKKYDVAAFLIENGANVNSVSLGPAWQKYTALSLAREQKATGIVNLLLAKGAKE